MHDYSTAGPPIPKEHVPPMHVWLQRHSDLPQSYGQVFRRALRQRLSAWRRR